MSENSALQSSPYFNHIDLPDDISPDILDDAGFLEAGDWVADYGNGIHREPIGRQRKRKKAGAYRGDHQIRTRCNVGIGSHHYGKVQAYFAVVIIQRG